MSADRLKSKDEPDGLNRLRSLSLVAPVRLCTPLLRSAVHDSLYICDYYNTIGATMIYNPEQVNPKSGFDAASTFLHKFSLGFPF